MWVLFSTNLMTDCIFIPKCDLFILSKWCYLPFLIIPYYHLTVKYNCLCIDIVLNKLTHLWSINPCIVIWVSWEELHYSILHMTLDSFSIKFHFHKYFRLLSDHICDLLRCHFRSQHRFDWEKHSKQLSTSFFSLFF